jgi:hypothetical protein
MQLLVPTNWDPALIAPLSRLEADVQLYGVLPTSLIGSGGSGPDITYMTRDQVDEYIQQAHSAGLKFDYILNAPSMSNMEWDENTHRELLDLLEWISSIGVDSVTVTIPYLLELIKRQFPHLKVRVSTIAHTDSVARAKSFELLGADSITLDFNVNRDFKVLKAIRSAVSCELSMLTNNLCLYQCPYAYYHHNGLGHASQSYNPLNGCYVDYCVLRCTLDRLCDISEIIKCRWIRSINSASPGAQNYTIGPPPKFYIDNQALEGFMDFFRKQDCLSGCNHCDYCQKIANEVIQFDRDEVDHYVAMLNVFLDDLSSSTFCLKLRQD